VKGFWKDFLLRGLLCAAGGPIVLAIIYGCLGATGAADTIPVMDVCKGILTISALAFIVAGMTAIYQVEKLPLATKILLHGGVLYVSYIFTYLFNGWLQHSLTPVLVFTGIFLAGYSVIWLIIYLVEKKKTDRVNKLLRS